MRETFPIDKVFGTPELAGVLLSGGLDSTTAAYLASHSVATQGKLVCISFDYGQRHSKELEFAARTADALLADHEILRIADIIPTTMLKDSAQALPNASYADLKGVSPTYVPFRNGLMIAAATSFLHGKLIREFPAGAAAHLYVGMHASDAAGFAYPDCTSEFAGSMSNAILMGTYGQMRLMTPFINMSKAEIVEKGNHLGVDFKTTWSCYAGGDRHCGTCPTCRDRREAFRLTGINDPTDYEQTV
jgi:7-cyano-7-deazaguanine synthase